MRGNKTVLTLKILVVVIFVVVTAYFGYKTFASTKPINVEIVPDEKQAPKEEIIPKLNIIDTDSKTRPIAVMIDNVPAALPHIGLHEAYIIYEIIVEGGQTRLLALFKDKDTATIGPVRSTRHYYIDYALENDAIFVHFGHSPKALSDINSLKINNINGMFDDKPFWRDQKRTAPHNVFTSIEKLTETADVKKYNATSDKKTLLNYSIDEVNLYDREDAIVSNEFRVYHSASHYIDYIYNDEDKIYMRSFKGDPYIDGITKEQLGFKNIIVYTVSNYNLPDIEAKGRQELANVGSGEGHYFTNGYAIPIKWEKTSREAQTIFKDLNGVEIDINDGNTFIHLQPVNQKLIIE